MIANGPHVPGASASPVEGVVSTFVLNPPGASPEPFLRLPDIGPKNAPTIFSFDDPAHVWMNERPYNVLRFLGQGGFGIVHKVELLTPWGFTVDPLSCDEAGLPDFEGKTTTPLKRRTSYSGPIPSPGAEGQKLNRSGLCFALKKMTPGKDDWDDCLKEIKLMQALKKVLILFAGRLINLNCYISVGGQLVVI